MERWCQSPGEGRAAAQRGGTSHCPKGRDKPLPLHSQRSMKDLYVSKQTVAKTVGVMACPYPGLVHHESQGISQITAWGGAMVGGVVHSSGRDKPLPLHSQRSMTDLYVSKQTVAKMVGVMACPYPGSVHHELRGISQITVWGDAMVGGVVPITGQGRAAANHWGRDKPLPLHSQRSMTDLYVSKQTVAKMVGVMACPYPGSVHYESRGISRITAWGGAMNGGVVPITGAGTSQCPKGRDKPLPLHNLLRSFHKFLHFLQILAEFAISQWQVRAGQ